MWKESIGFSLLSKAFFAEIEKKYLLMTKQDLIRQKPHFNILIKNFALRVMTLQSNSTT